MILLIINVVDETAISKKSVAMGSACASWLEMPEFNFPAYARVISVWILNVLLVLVSMSSVYKFSPVKRHAICGVRN